MKLQPSEIKTFADRFLVKPDSKVRIKDFDPGDTAGYRKTENAQVLLEQGIQMLTALQEQLYAEGAQGLLIIFQAMDAAGKDSTIKHVMSGINPQGCQVTSFKVPSAEELSHDYLWRCVKVLPPRGFIGIFNRSYYEEVLVVRVHPEFLNAQRLPARTLGESLWRQRFEEINNFEKYLVNNGFEIVKIFLNVSKDEQCQRQLERIDKPAKNWKFNPRDLEERERWDDYLAAFEDALQHTSTPWAPWHVVPADRKWFTRLAVAAIIVSKLLEMNPQFPTVSEEDRQAMAQCRVRLLDECGPEKEEAT